MNNFQNVTSRLHHKLWFFLILVFPIVISAQTATAVNDTLVYTSSGVDKEPVYPSGIKSFYQYVSDNFNLPTAKEFTGGKVFTSFVIEKDGTITDVKALRDMGFGTGAEAVRVLKTSPVWIPGEVNGAKVRVRYNLPLTLQPPPPSVAEPAITTTDKIEVQPSFNGGIPAFYKFISSNFRVPEEEGLNGKIIVSFVVGIDGTLTDIRVLKALGFGTADEIVRVLKLSPKWIPAMQDGKPIPCTFVLPVVINTGQTEFEFHHSDKNPSDPFPFTDHPSIYTLRH